ncbi:hypothetical protein E1A91_D13G281200v1 [Gossypium mustelinum]|uniref:Uncharacterized protein n=1 Tax=Gossypium mustelinum TaxID=34275 RepID=A0A5D2S738_GOSMU|nr:hypothetical protein E1A91_D13G281200v1 [Gossypium mustelinum]
MLQSIHSFFLFCFHYSLFLPSRTSRILFWSLPLLRGSVITDLCVFPCFPVCFCLSFWFSAL